MSTTKQELERLLELKRMQGELQVLNQDLMQERMRLELRHKKYIDLSCAEMEQQLSDPITMSVKTSVQSDNMSAIIADYNTLYQEEKWYQEPNVNDDPVLMSFPSKEILADFFQKQSEKNRSFIVSEVGTNKLMAYSNGDGKLYHADGKEYTGGILVPHDIDANEFARTHQSSMSPS